MGSERLTPLAFDLPSALKEALKISKVSEQLCRSLWPNAGDSRDIIRAVPREPEELYDPLLSRKRYERETAL